MIRALRVILSAAENENPYEISEHLSIQRGNPIDCEEPEMWLDTEHLIPRHELEDTDFFFCPACQHQYNTWEQLLDQSADEGEPQSTQYAHRAYQALSLEQHIEDGIFSSGELSAIEYDDLGLLKAERRKLEAFHNWEQRQESAQLRSKHG